MSRRDISMTQSVPISEEWFADTGAVGRYFYSRGDGDDGSRLVSHRYFGVIQEGSIGYWRSYVYTAGDPNPACINYNPKTFSGYFPVSLVTASLQSSVSPTIGYNEAERLYKILAKLGEKCEQYSSAMALAEADKTASMLKDIGLGLLNNLIRPMVNGFKNIPKGDPVLSIKNPHLGLTPKAERLIKDKARTILNLPGYKPPKPPEKVAEVIIPKWGRQQGPGGPLIKTPRKVKVLPIKKPKPQKSPRSPKRLKKGNTFIPGTPLTKDQIKELSKDGAGLFLLCDFGVLPLLADIEEKLGDMAHDLNSGFNQSMRVRAGTKYDVSTENQEATNYMSVFTDLTCFRETPVNAERLGRLRPNISVYQVLWERFPFSWLIDYFAPIGPLMQAYMALRLVSSPITYGWLDICTTKPYNPYPFGTKPFSWVMVGSCEDKQIVSSRRILDHSLPGLMIEFELNAQASLRQWAHISAALTQLSSVRRRY